MLSFDEGRRIYIATHDGHVQLWTPGAEHPTKEVVTGGEYRSLRGKSALLHPLHDGKILFVETNGRIVLFDQQLSILSARTLFGVGEEEKQSKEPVPGQQSMIAYAATDGRQLGIGYEKWGVGINSFLLPLDPYLEEGTENLNKIAKETWTYNSVFRFSFKSSPYIKFIINDYIGKTEEVQNEDEVSAIAVCNNYTIIGTMTRNILFVDNDNFDSERSRVVSVRENSEENLDGKIVDVGCLGKDYAYSIAIDGDFGHVQLWDINEKSLLDWIDEKKGGHMGMAFRAIASQQNTLLTLGHGEIKLWSIKNSKLEKIGEEYFDSEGEWSNQDSDAVALADGSFLVWDGERIKKLKADGSSFEYFAGPQ
ncbi:hypothetical protein H4W29_005371 [Rhizobium viscosum]|uniref:WD40 repeat domain-containing protein n=1 Tax=Rhizobium viscosum TaxID=1673 RepID=A0ABR9IY14_RHIVS|nr:hypothetical protein [Rhizobium viscosum]